MKNKPPRRARLSLDLDAKTKSDFEAVRAREGVGSLTNLIKKSVALFDVATAHQKKGGSIIFKHQDDTEERILFL